MPRIRVRKDGSAYTYARVSIEIDAVRCWEVTPEGIALLATQGIGVEEEMGRARFSELVKKGHAYIANPSTKRAPIRRKRTSNDETVTSSGVRVEMERGPAGTRRIITVPAHMREQNTNSAKQRGAGPRKRDRK